jgi:hypothetical protein
MKRMLIGQRMFVPLIIYGWLFFSIWMFDAQVSNIFFASLIEIWVLVAWMVFLRFFEAGWNLTFHGFEKMVKDFSLRSPNLTELAMGTAMLTVFQWILMIFFLTSQFEDDIEFADLGDLLFSESMRWVMLVSVLAYGVSVWKERGFHNKNSLLEHSFVLEIAAFFFMNVAAVLLAVFSPQYPILIVSFMIAVRFLVGVWWNGKKALA